MSLGIYPQFDSKLKDATFSGLGEVLAANFEALDEIARSAKLTPFTAFADNRPVCPRNVKAICGDCFANSAIRCGESGLLTRHAQRRTTSRHHGGIQRPVHLHE